MSSGEGDTGKQKLFYPDYIFSIGGKVWILEVKGNFNASGGSENIDIYAPKKSAALMAYCARHGICGGFVCYDEGQDEILTNEGRFSEDRNDPNWKTIEGTTGSDPSEYVAVNMSAAESWGQALVSWGESWGQALVSWGQTLREFVILARISCGLNS